ncbi:methyltransferase domain-containing protein [Streptomyces sp. NBRC 110035]|uniref:methyltransferase domain-containing protein n=1 Tax=Streptomyces sp. NBRC 110035 TaxID=1547867 RepID=UPI00099BFC5D
MSHGRRSGRFSVSSFPSSRSSSLSFDELVAEGAAVPTEGWDFSWFDGRATEARPSWGYARALAARLGAEPGAAARTVLDVQTGGGEVLSLALDAARRVAPDGRRPALVVATEGWVPNAVKAAGLLRARGGCVVAVSEDASARTAFPFADGAFDLVVSRHPVEAHWREIARVLRPGGGYFAQHVGPGSAYELVEHFLGPQSDEQRNARHPERERREAEAAGLEIVDLRAERLRMEFYDIAAVVHFLRKVIWMVPGFTVEAYLPQLRALHERILAEGAFVAHSSRHLFDLRKP